MHKLIGDYHSFIHLLKVVIQTVDHFFDRKCKLGHFRMIHEKNSHQWPVATLFLSAPITFIQKSLRMMGCNLFSLNRYTFAYRLWNVWYKEPLKQRTSDTAEMVFEKYWSECLNWNGKLVFVQIKTEADGLVSAAYEQKKYERLFVRRNSSTNEQRDNAPTNERTN